MVYYDIHTHHLPVHPEDAAIVNSLVPTFDVGTGLFRSVGIHPWELTEHNAGQLLDYLKQQLRKKQFVAVGEAGLDKLAVASMELQLTVFKAQVRLSEEYGLPLIIHCVKAMDELLAVKKEFRPQQAWIWHGFRGKTEQAVQLLKKGFYLSLGIRYNEDSLRVIPLDRLFLETDDSETDICQVYERAARTLGISVIKLTEQIQHNIKKVFFNG